jgi:hypothetical protein
MGLFIFLPVALTPIPHTVENITVPEHFTDHSHSSKNHFRVDVPFLTPWTETQTLRTARVTVEAEVKRFHFRASRTCSHQTLRMFSIPHTVENITVPEHFTDHSHSSKNHFRVIFLPVALRLSERVLSLPILLCLSSLNIRVDPVQNYRQNR